MSFACVIRLIVTAAAAVALEAPTRPQAPLHRAWAAAGASTPSTAALAARRALGTVAAAAVLAQPSAAFAAPLDGVLSAAATLDALSLADRACAQKALGGPPFTDAALPSKGGNVPPSQVPFIPGLYYPKALFAADYERPLPTIGNALRKNINEAGKGLRFNKPQATMDGDVFVERAKTEAALSMDYLDLLRNEWLDAVQQLESNLDDEGFDAKVAATDLDAARRGARKWLEAAQVGPPALVGALCSE